MEKILFVVPHGLGDHVVLTPALRKYKKENPQAYITVAGLERFGKTLKQLLSNLSFIDEVITILPDPWKDGPSKYETNLDEVLKVADEYGKQYQYTQGVFLPTNRQEGYRLHKIFRFETEVGVSFSCIEDLIPELSVTEESIKEARRILKDSGEKTILFHNNAGNPPKEFEGEELDKLLDNFKEYKILEFGKDIPLDNMELSKALIKEAKLVVAIDSVVMHIAGAFQTPLVALFKNTPVHQALPMHYNVRVLGYDTEITQIQNTPKYRYLISEMYGFPKFKIDNPVILLGDVDDKELTKKDFDYNRYKKLQLEVEKHEGTPRIELEDYGENAVKFFKEVEKYLPKPEELPEGLILDMGGATGYHSKMLSEKYNKKVKMIDINPELISIAKKNCKEHNVICTVMDANNITFKNNKYSFIFAKDIVEHFYDPPKAIKKIYKLLKNKGIILVFMPLDGSNDNTNIVDLSMSKGYNVHTWKATYTSVQEEFKKVGFKIEAHKVKISDITGDVRQFGNDAIILIGRKSI